MESNMLHIVIFAFWALAGYGFTKLLMTMLPTLLAAILGLLIVPAVAWVTTTIVLNIARRWAIQRLLRAR
jgi:hypothetical protein